MMKLWGLTVGNVLEWYDYAIYGSPAPIIAIVFFPHYAHSTAILLTLTIFAVGFVCRPIGAFIFGYIADKRGRKPAFLISVLLMVFPTLFISVLPTYRAIGYLAPLLLMLCRLLQGIAVGGEYPVAATFCLWWLIRPNPVVGLTVIILFGTFYAGLLLVFYHEKQW